MARMIPPSLSHDGRDGGIPSGELRLFNALQDDPTTPSWTVLHSVHVANHRRGVGEADFVVIVPGKGILVIEVKSARDVMFRDGLWHGLQKSPRTTRLSPFTQADQVQHSIMRALRGSGIDLTSIPLVHCVWFTSWRAKEHLPTSPAWEDWQVLDNTDLDADPDQGRPLALQQRMTIRQVADHYHMTPETLTGILHRFGAPDTLAADDTIEGKIAGLLENKGLLRRPRENTPVPSTIVRTLERGAEWLQTKDGITKDFCDGYGPDAATADRIAGVLAPDSDDPENSPSFPDDVGTSLVCCRVAYENDHEFTFLAHGVLRAGLDIEFLSESAVASGYLEVYAVSGRLDRLAGVIDHWGPEDQLLNGFAITAADAARRTGTLRALTDDEDLTIEVSQSDADLRSGEYVVRIRNDPYGWVDNFNHQVEEVGVDVAPLDREAHKNSTGSSHPEMCQVIAELAFGNSSRWPAAQPFLPTGATARIANG